MKAGGKPPLSLGAGTKSSTTHGVEVSRELIENSPRASCRPS
jgi:hypothetical protein